MKITCQSCLDAADEKSFPGCFQKEKAGQRDVLPPEHRYGSLLSRGQMKLAAKCTCRDAQQIPQVLSRAGAARVPGARAQGCSSGPSSTALPCTAQCSLPRPGHIRAWLCLSISAGHTGPALAIPKSKERLNFCVYGVTRHDRHTETFWTWITVSFVTLSFNCQPFSLQINHGCTAYNQTSFFKKYILI